MKIRSTYRLEKVLKMLSLYVNAILCTLQHTVKHAMQLSGVNSENWHRWVASRVWHYAAACTKLHWRTRRSFSAPSLTSKYFAFAFVSFPVQSPRTTPTLVYETAGRFFVRHSVLLFERRNNKTFKTLQFISRLNVSSGRILRNGLSNAGHTCAVDLWSNYHVLILKNW
jgi:hypothetical protein